MVAPSGENDLSMSATIVSNFLPGFIVKLPYWTPGFARLEVDFGVLHFVQHTISRDMKAHCGEIVDALVKVSSRSADAGLDYLPDSMAVFSKAAS